MISESSSFGVILSAKTLVSLERFDATNATRLASKRSRIGRLGFRRAYLFSGETIYEKNNKYNIDRADACPYDILRYERGAGPEKACS